MLAHDFTPAFYTRAGLGSRDWAHATTQKNGDNTQINRAQNIKSPR